MTVCAVTVLVWICLATAKATSPSLVYLMCIQIRRGSFCKDINPQACHVLPSWSLAGSAKDHNQVHLGAERQETAGNPESARHLQSRASP